MSLEDIAKTIQDLPIDEEKKQEMVSQLREEHEKSETLRKSAIRGAIAAIVNRNLSHGVMQGAINQIENQKAYHDFLDHMGMEKSDNIDFKKIFLNDTNRLNNHPFYIRYKQLRESGMSVVKSIKKLDRSSILLSQVVSSSMGLPSNLDIINGSRVANLEYCNGRLNTILGILYLHEGEEYIKKNVKIADVIRDSLEDIMQSTPSYNKDKSRLQEYMFYEDPHSILLIEGEQLDPNIIMINDLTGIVQNHKIVELKGNDMLEVSYLMQYIMYLNTFLSEQEKMDNKYGFLDIVKDTFYNIVGESEMLAKFIIHCQKDSESEKIFNLMIHKHPELKDRFRVMFHLFDTSQISTQEFNNFIKTKYGSNFDLQDILDIYS